MSFIVPYLWLVFATATLTILTRKRFETVFPLTFILGTFSFYFCGFFEQISAGLIFCSVLGFGALPLVYIHRKRYKEIFDNFFTLGFVVFTLFYAYFVFYHRYTAFSTWDEFQHWGPMIKETMRLDAFYSVPASTLQTHKDYPPIISVLQAMWCHLSGGYGEAYCYRALSVFSVSLFLPAFSKLDIKKVKDWGWALLHSMGIIFVNLVSFVLLETFFSTIYIDFVLGLFSAYVLFLVVQSQGKLSVFNCINIGLSLTFLMMIKQMSIAFYAMSLFLLVGLIVFHKEKVSFKQIVLSLVFMVIVPFAVSKSWELYNLPFDLGWQFKISELSIGDFLNLVVNRLGEPWQVEALDNYIEAIVSRPLITSPFNMTYGGVNFVITALIFGVFMILNNNLKESLLVSVTYVIGIIGYAITMMMLYTYSFGSYEGPMLASFERYINTYLYLGFCFLLMCYLWFVSDKKSAKTCLIEICGIAVLILMSGKGTFDRLKVPTSYAGYMSDSQYTSIFGQMEAALEEGDRVLVVSQYVDITVQILKYKYPEYVFTSVSLGLPKYNGDAYSINYSLDQWIDLYSQYDYIYLYKTDDVFYHDYWTSVTDLEMYNLNLYRVKNNNFCLVAPDGQCYE